MKAEKIADYLKSVAFYKNGKQKPNWENPIWLLKNPNEKVHYIRYKGRFGRAHLVTDHTAEVLEALGISYSTGNDAPRGGQTGDYIYLTAKGKRQVRDFAKSEYFSN